MFGNWRIFQLWNSQCKKKFEIYLPSPKKKQKWLPYTSIKFSTFIASCKVTKKKKKRKKKKREITIFELNTGQHFRLPRLERKCTRRVGHKKIYLQSRPFRDYVHLHITWRVVGCVRVDVCQKHEEPSKLAVLFEIVDTATLDGELRGEKKKRDEIVASLLVVISVMDRRIRI